MIKIRNRKVYLAGGSALVIITLLAWSPIINPIDSFMGSTWSEEAFWADLNECTTGLASGLATPDGRPLLWKNRDVGNSNQEFHYYDDGRIPFISITYRGENDEYYGGVNAVGFAVENSNSYNLEGGPYRNGWGGGDDDGEIHLLALATCRTVDDFEAILDSTNEEGRTLNCNYGAIDAFGGAAMFETAGYSYARYDAAETPDGFIVRANYSYSGRDLDDRDTYWGPHRHDRAYELFKRGADNHDLTPLYLYQTVIRDLTIDGTDPYPLPFDGYVGNNPYGLIPNGEAIGRATTRGILVVQGVREGERPDDSVIWAMLGSQMSSVFTPLWVRAGSVPEEIDGPQQGSRICNRANEIRSWVYDNGMVNTWKLTNPEQNGFWDYALPLERWVYAKTQRFLNSPRFSYDQLESYQNEIAQQVADSLIAWKPGSSVTDVPDIVVEDDNIRLIWDDEFDGERLFGERSPRGFNVYRSSEPFRDGNRGELLSFVEEPEFIDDNPLSGFAFYRVVAQF